MTDFIFYILYLYNIMVSTASLTGPPPEVLPMVGASGPRSALEMGNLNSNHASNLQALAGGFKVRRSRRRRSRRVKRGSKKYKKGRKLTRHRRTKRSAKRSTKRLYKGGATGDPIPYSAPTGSNAAVLNISEELALAHATANLNAKFDGAARNAP
jgi:hypothetical protein